MVMATYLPVEKAEWLKAKTAKAEVKCCLLNELHKPVVLEGWIDSWQVAGGWSPVEVCRALGNRRSTFKVCARRGTSAYRRRFDDSEAVFETECDYVEATFLDFSEWLVWAEGESVKEEEEAKQQENQTEMSPADAELRETEDKTTTDSLSPPRKRKKLQAAAVNISPPSPSFLLSSSPLPSSPSLSSSPSPPSPPKNPLLSLPPSQFWVYADYKYMSQLCPDCTELTSAIDWGVFGFHGRRGNDSTLWVGSRGAFTPCHYDTYGCNLVAQLWGRKRWVLFSPVHSSRLYPTRIPFEESSVFSEVCLGQPDLHRFPAFASAVGYQVVLCPGDVLFIPHHWWHYVECTEPAVSVNTWVSLPSDSYEKVKEAVVRTIVGGVLTDDSTSSGGRTREWVNPNEEVFPHSTNLELLSVVVADHLLQQNHQPPSPFPSSSLSPSPSLTPLHWAKVLTSSAVVEAVAGELLKTTRDHLDQNSDILDQSEQ